MTNATSAAATAPGASDLTALCATLAAAFSLPASEAPRLAEALKQAPRPSVIWLSMQECTGCAEALTRSYMPALEDLIFDFISLDYQHTLQAASGEAAELAREHAMQEHYGRYLWWWTVPYRLGIPAIRPSPVSAICNSSKKSPKERQPYCAWAHAQPMAACRPNSQSDRCGCYRRPRKGQAGYQHPRLSTNSRGHHWRDCLLSSVRHRAGTGQSRAAESLLRRIYPSTLLPAPILRTGPVRREFRRRGSAQGLVPLQARLKGPSTYNACSTLKWN